MDWLAERLREQTELSSHSWRVSNLIDTYSANERALSIHTWHRNVNYANTPKFADVNRRSIIYLTRRQVPYFRLVALSGRRELVKCLTCHCRFHDIRVFSQDLCLSAGDAREGSSRVMPGDLLQETECCFINQCSSHSA